MLSHKPMPRRHYRCCGYVGRRPHFAPGQNRLEAVMGILGKYWHACKLSVLVAAPLLEVLKGQGGSSPRLMIEPLIPVGRVGKGETHGKQMGCRGSAGCACARGRQGQGTRSVVLRAAQPHSAALLDVPPA